MNNRIFTSDKQALIDEGKRIVSASDDAKFIRKVTIVTLILNGALASELSPLCGETARTLTSWVKKADEEGFDSLRSKKHTGRPTKLNPDQKEAVKAALLSSPENYGYEAWNGLSLSDYIFKTYSIRLSIRQCQRLLHDSGLS